jgi:hypothetical protein
VAGVVATVTVVDPQQAGFLTLWPSGDQQPATSNLNFQAGQNIATTVIVPVSGDWALRLFNGSFGTVQVLVDVTGYTLSGTPTASGTVVYPAAARIADSRSGLQIPGAVPALGTVAVQVAAPGGEVAAAVLTVTVVDPHAGGYVTVWPSGTNRPGTSNLNFRAGQNIATTVIVPVGADGKIQLFNGSPGSADLIVDFRGYTLPTVPAASGAAWAWGAGPDGQLGNGMLLTVPVPVRVSGLSDVIGIAGNGVTAYAVRGDGTVWAWGSGSSIPAQVPELTDITAVDASNALRGDGTVWAFGNDLSAAPVKVTGLTGVTAIASSGANSYALLGDGTVRAWGYGGVGGLGNGDTADSAAPVKVSTLTGVTAIGAGGITGYAVLGDGTVWAWGDGSWGQLGNGQGGPSSRSSVPVQVPGLTDDVTAVAGASFTGYALHRDGTVSAWGEGHYGELGDGSTTVISSGPVPVAGLTHITAIAAGRFTGYALARR